MSFRCGHEHVLAQCLRQGNADIESLRLHRDILLSEEVLVSVADFDVVGCKRVVINLYLPESNCETGCRLNHVRLAKTTSPRSEVLAASIDHKIRSLTDSRSVPFLMSRTRRMVGFVKCCHSPVFDSVLLVGPNCAPRYDLEYLAST